MRRERMGQGRMRLICADATSMTGGTPEEGDEDG
jgi:hypothetical protein